VNAKKNTQNASIVISDKNVRKREPGFVCPVEKQLTLNIPNVTIAILERENEKELGCVKFVEEPSVYSTQDVIHAIQDVKISLPNGSDISGA
jgi:hypothetical protein